MSDQLDPMVFFKLVAQGEFQAAHNFISNYPDNKERVKQAAARLVEPPQAVMSRVPVEGGHKSAMRQICDHIKAHYPHYLLIVGKPMSRGADHIIMHGDGGEAGFLCIRGLCAYAQAELDSQQATLNKEKSV